MIRKSGFRYYTVNNHPRVNNMVAGNSNYYLKSKHRIRTPSSTVSFFGGQHPSVVPIYTLWRQFRQGRNQVRDFVYWTFYPYNRGKNVCIGVAGSGRCFGGCTVMGNHVADWEHVTVRLVNNRPSQMYIGAHNFGGVYNWNGETFVKGKDKVTFSLSGHPIVYSAKGSHGLWTRRGRITYQKLLNGEVLQELVSSGTVWDTWKNVKLIRYIKGKHYTGNLQWMNFKGRWGDPKRGCAALEKISNECRLNDGPEGPAIKSVMKERKLS
ncbi:uncharacterized protein LOC135691121 isoform X1 [Rhopilema esculentum]|uniref:uncharacterized protein LOC135691121 isoform X1 n=1 Tax=Rhopilema esculentum TaxID=499914 RepID=UPI0031D665E0